MAVFFNYDNLWFKSKNKVMGYLEQMFFLDGIPALPHDSLARCFSRKGELFWWIPNNLPERLPRNWCPTEKRDNLTNYWVTEGKSMSFEGLVDFIGGPVIAWRKVFFPSQVRWLIDQQANGEYGFLDVGGWPNVFMTGGYINGETVLMPLFASYSADNKGWAVWTMDPGDPDPGAPTQGKFCPWRCNIIF